MDQLGHQRWLSDILEVEAQVHRVVVYLLVHGLAVNKLFYERGQCLRHDRAQGLVLEDSRSHTIHGEDLDAERGHTPTVATVAHMLLHVSNVAKSQMLLVIVRLEKLDALLHHALASLR